MADEEYTIKNVKKDIDDLKRESRIQTIESHIQTIAVVAVFFFGVVTIYDIYKKIKK
jgi:hypothetical protein